MNRILIVALAATSFVATPVFAQEVATSNFSGPRIGVNLGVADDKMFGTDEITYGGEIGYDHDIGTGVIGFSAEYQDSKDLDREFALTGRVGGKVGNSVLVYALGGYSNLKAFGIKLDGYRVGGGVEFALGSRGFVKLEQRYANYELDLDLHQSVIGGGIRF